MRPWTLEQRSAIIESYWRGVARCPIDDSILATRSTGGSYPLSVVCGVCPQSAVLQQGLDPRSATFRTWEVEEVDRMMEVWMAEKVPFTCPVCQTEVEAPPPFRSWTPLVEVCFRCPRCGESQVRPVPAVR